MPASSGTLRTYGKRPSVKRKESSDEKATSKRRKVSKDPGIRTPSPSRTESDAKADADTDVEFVEELSVPVKPKVSKTYGSPSATPSKVVRDFSGIFNSVSPASPLGFRSPAATPTKLAKRMLGRSKTESSVESQSPSVKEQHNNEGNGIDRTSSLPNLSSSSSAPLTPNRLSSNDHSSSTLSLSRPTIFPAVTKGSLTRTYAGKYRSFLMALPAASGSTSKGLLDEDEFETRESYSSLRSRWGVDNSEDDPHPSYDISSPSNSTTTTSDASPSRNVNGKGKAAIRTVPVPNGMMNPLKSISELRNKGESRRFLDEVGYLFEGLDPKCGIALRRSSALEITTKLCDPEFTRKAKAADFFGRTWELFLLAGAGKGEDKVLDILLVFFLALIARDPVSLAELAERPTNNLSSESHQDTSLVNILIRILEAVSSESDLLTLSDQNSRPSVEVERPATTIPKKDRTILSLILKVITSKSNLFPPCTPISIPLLIASTLQTLPALFLSVSCLPTLLDSLRRCLSPHLNSDASTHASSSSTTLYTSLSSESKWLEIVKYVPYESVYHHLKLVDAYLVGQWTAIMHETDPDREKQEVVVGHQYLEKAKGEWMIQDLVALGVCCELKIKEEAKGDDTKADSEDVSLSTAHQKSFILTLRVLISLTHNHKGWARDVLGCRMTMGLILRTMWKAGRELRCHTLDDEGESEDEEVEGNSRKVENENERDGGAHAFDTLCLVLGLLTNLIQVMDAAKDVVRRSRLNPSCTLRNRACLKRCMCAQEPRKEKGREDGKERSGVEMLVWLYERLQRDRDEGRRRRESRHEDAHLGEDHSKEQAREQENEAQISFLCGHLSVLFGLLMMGKLGAENRGVILGLSGADLVPHSSSPHRPTSRQRDRKGQRRQKRGVIEDSDETDTPTKTVSTRLRLTRLADQAREFGAFYTVVSRQMTRMTLGRGFVVPSASCAGFVGECDGGIGDGSDDADLGDGRSAGKEESEEGRRECPEQEQGGMIVVQRVVEFLEGLRDLNL